MGKFAAQDALKAMQNSCCSNFWGRIVGLQLFPRTRVLLPGVAELL